MPKEQKRREYLVRAMDREGFDLATLSRKTRASPTLLRMLINGEVTHPNIAMRVGRALELTEAQILSMMPERYRAARLPLRPMEGMDFDGGKPLPMKSGEKVGGPRPKREWSIRI